MVSLMVSLNTKTPERNAQPAMTASAERRRRPLRARTFFSAMRSTSFPEALHAVEHLLRCRLGHLVDDLAVGEEDDAIGVARRDRIVGDHHDGLAELVHGAAHE